MIRFYLYELPAFTKEFTKVRKFLYYLLQRSKKERCIIGSSSSYQKGRDRLRDLCIDGGIIIKWILKKYAWGSGLDSYGLNRVQWRVLLNSVLNLWRRKELDTRLYTGNMQCKRLLARPGRSYKDNIKAYLKEIGCKTVDWIHVTYNVHHWWAVVNTVMTFRFCKWEVISWLPEWVPKFVRGLLSVNSVLISCKGLLPTSLVLFIAALLRTPLQKVSRPSADDHRSGRIIPCNMRRQA